MAIGRPLQISWAAADTPAALHAAFRAEGHAEVAVRLQALWLLAEGTSIHAAAQRLGLGERSIRRWVAWYRRGGLAAVRQHHQAGTGKPPRLSAAQQAQLQTHLGEGSTYTARDAVTWVAETFAVRYRPGGMYSLLRRLGCRPKVPRPVNPKTSAETQAAWKKGGLSLP